MSYKFSRGFQIIGDLSGSDDANRDTGIDFEENEIKLVAGGSDVLKVSGSDVYLNDGSNIHLGNDSIIFFDGYDTTNDCYITQNPDNSITIDGNNYIKLVGDQGVIVQHNTTEKVNFNFTSDVATVSMPISSSQDISASALHLQEGMNIAGETIFNSQGNIVGTSATAVITIADNVTTGDTISFGDSTITPVVVSTYQARVATGDNILRGGTAAATRTNTKTKLESLHNVSVTIDGNDLIITNNNLGPIGNRTISETFTSANNSVSGFTGGYAIDIFANEITASSFSSPDGTLISAEGNFQGNDASFNEITASSNLSFSGSLFLNNTEKLIDSQGDHAFLQTMVVELSIPGTDVQTDSSAFRFFCPYDMTINELQLYLDSIDSGEDVTVQLSGSGGFTQSLTLNGTDNASTGSLNGSVQSGELVNFEITTVNGTVQGLIANLLYRRTLP